MATVYRRRELRDIPAGATTETYRGKLYAKWLDGRTGRTARAPLNADRTKIVQEAEFYTVQYFDEHWRQRKAKTRCADEDAAQQIANGIEADVAKRKRGHIDQRDRTTSTAQRGRWRIG